MSCKVYCECVHCLVCACVLSLKEAFQTGSHTIFQIFTIRTVNIYCSIVDEARCILPFFCSILREYCISKVCKGFSHIGCDKSNVGDGEIVALL